MRIIIFFFPPFFLELRPMQILNEETKSKLLSEFQELKTLEEKLNFWSTRLPVNYITYWEGGIENHQEIFNNLHPFDIKIEEQERVKYAKWVLDNYHDLSKKQNPYKELLDFDQLRKSFERKLEDSDNKLEAVRKELMTIRKEVRPPVPSSGGGLIRNAHYVASLMNKFNADYSTFEDYKEQSLSPNYQEISSVYSILRAENGFTVGKYWKYLKGLETELADQNKIKQATLDQKLLILHYLGALDKIMNAENATKRSVFLEKVIGNDAEKIRQRFSSINDLVGTPKESAKRRKLKEELTEIQEVFKDLGLQNIVKKIQADLRKLSQ